MSEVTKKIVQLSKFYPPDRGGIESVVHEIVRNSISNGFSTTVLCFTHKKNLVIEPSHNLMIIRAPVSLTIKSQPISLAYFLHAISLSKAADIIHLHLPNFMALFATLFFVHKKSKKIIIHWHSDVIDKGLMYWLLKPLEHMALKIANNVIATSPNYLSSSIPLKKFHGKCTVIPIGIEDPCLNVTNESESFPSDWSNILSGKKLILSVGRLVPYKGFDVLINAARYLPADAIVFIVGSGPLHSTLTGMIRALDLSTKVYIIPNVDHHALHDFYRRASLFCLPSNSRAEAFGVVLLEAMAHSLPLVTCSIFGSGVSFVNQNKVTGVVAPTNDPIQLATALSSILTNQSLHALCSKNSRIRFKTEFENLIMSNRIQQLYNQSVISQ